MSLREGTWVIGELYRHGFDSDGMHTFHLVLRTGALRFRQNSNLIKVLFCSIFTALLCSLLVFYLLHSQQSGDESFLRGSSAAMPASTSAGQSPAIGLSLKAFVSIPEDIADSHINHTQNSNRKLRASKPKESVRILQSLLDEGLLDVGHKVCLLSGSRGAKEILALKRLGIQKVTSIDPMVPLSTQQLVDESFDFEFTSLFDDMHDPSLFVVEIERTLRVGGIAAMHVSLSTWREKFMSSEAGRATQPVTMLFHHSDIVFVLRAYASGRDTVIVFRKNSQKKIQIRPPVRGNPQEGPLEQLDLYNAPHQIYLHIKTCDLASTDMLLLKSESPEFLLDKLEGFSYSLLSNLSAETKEGYMADDWKFIDWLNGLVVGHDLVIVKMSDSTDDAKLVGRLVETGAIYIINEFFLVGKLGIDEGGHTEFFTLIGTLSAKGVGVKIIR